MSSYFYIQINCASCVRTTWPVLEYLTHPCRSQQASCAWGRLELLRLTWAQDSFRGASHQLPCARLAPGQEAGSRGRDAGTEAPRHRLALPPPPTARPALPLRDRGDQGQGAPAAPQVSLGGSSRPGPPGGPCFRVAGRSLGADVGGKVAKVD